MQADDDAAFEAFVAARSADLLRTAVLLTRDRGQAEDLLQTALVTAYRRWARIGATDPYPCVRRILLRTAASRWRLRGRQEIVALPEHDPWGPVDAETSAERDRMTGALAGLPPRMRAVLVLRYMEGLGEIATAEALGCPVRTVRTETVRGMARLRSVLGRSVQVTVLEEC